MVILWSQQNRVDRVGHLSRYGGSAGQSMACTHFPRYCITPLLPSTHSNILTLTMTMTITMILVDEYTSTRTALVRVRPGLSSSTLVAST